jgi:hypothetical protein
MFRMNRNNKNNDILRNYNQTLLNLNLQNKISGINIEDLKNKSSKTTIVTAYYNIKSKYPSNTYISWMQNFLKIPCNLVVFTDEGSYDIIKNFRISFGLEHKTVIILKRIEEFYNYKYIDYYKYCHSIDIENNYHTPELYMIWNEKTYFVKEVLEKNPFHSEWFFWTDIGCVRDVKMFDFICNYPNDDKVDNLNKEKMNLVCIQNFHENDFHKDEKGIPLIFKNRGDKCCDNIIRIQGGFFGGHLNSWKGWIENFEKVFNHFMESKTFVGKDQYLMASVYINNKDSINLIEASSMYGDPWFYFLYNFS